MGIRCFDICQRNCKMTLQINVLFSSWGGLVKYRCLGTFIVTAFYVLLLFLLVPKEGCDLWL